MATDNLWQFVLSDVYSGEFANKKPEMTALAEGTNRLGVVVQQ